jgi:hypothetical protein
MIDKQDNQLNDMPSVNHIEETDGSINQKPAVSDTVTSFIPAEPEATAANDIIEAPDEVILKLENISIDVKTISQASAKTAVEIREMHKLFHNEFSGRLQSMQEELERYHEIDKGRIYDDILREIAKLYSDNVSVVDGIDDDKAKKRLNYLFLDLLQILESKGVSKQESKSGDKRNTRHCHVVNRIVTDNPEQHDTVAKSRNTGFFIENRTLVKEMVDIYIFSEKAT